MSQKEIFDYVIVGGGSAGCVLANRLSANPAHRVLLLEAGGWDRDPWISIPLGVGRILQKGLHDWGYHSEPEEHFDGRRVECARGKVIGGSSSINAMAYVRGHRSDYDRWAAAGLTGWSYEEVLPYFRRQEAWEGGADEYRGATGLLGTRVSHYEDPLTEAILESGVRAGHPTTDDYNGREQHGMALMQSTIRNGRRSSSAAAFLRPAMRRPNLVVRTRALASRVQFDGDRAVGIVYRHGGYEHLATAEKEVLLCGGVINTPQLLMLSGVGDPVELRSHDINLEIALPGVGCNLQDHVKVPLSFRREEPGPMHRRMRIDRIAADLARAYITGTGFATDLPGPVCSFLKSDPSLLAPDVQILLNSGSMQAGPYLSPFVKPYEDGFTLLVVLLRPQSRGRLRLASKDPSQPLKIYQNFLAERADQDGLRKAFDLARDITRQGPLARLARSEIGPGPAARTPADINAHVRATATSVHHPLGTCKMGVASDPLAVVDAQLRVRGARALRVVDASVMPDMVGGNINAPVMMIAERAAEMILAQVPVIPARSVQTYS